MKILYVVNGYPTEKMPEFCIFTKEQIERIRETKIVDSEVFFINARENGIFEYFRAIPKLRSKILLYELVHCFHGLSLILLFLIAPKKRIIVSFLNSIDYEYSGNNKLLVRPLIHLTRLIIKRKNIFKIFKDKIPPAYQRDCRTFYLPNGVNLNFFYPIDKKISKKRLGLKLSKRYVLYVSSRDIYRRQKRYDRFSEVLEILKEKYHFNNLEELLLNNVPRSKVLDYFNSADLHLLTSDFEGSPNSIKEAMACNVPVVSTNVGNVMEMFDGLSKENFISCSFDVDDLARLTANILNGKTEIPDFRSHIINRKFDEKSKTSELIDTYQKVYAS